MGLREVTHIVSASTAERLDCVVKAKRLNASGCRSALETTSHRQLPLKILATRNLEPDTQQQVGREDPIAHAPRCGAKFIDRERAACEHSAAQFDVV
jgi:hypothetical protein